MEVYRSRSVVAFPRGGRVNCGREGIRGDTSARHGGGRGSDRMRFDLFARHLRIRVCLQDRIDEAGEMRPVKPSSFGRRTGFNRRYPGGAE